MTFARWVFRLAAYYGLAALLPQYFIEERFEPSALATLGSKINSSPGASAYQLGSGLPDPATVAEAETLSR